MKSERNNLKKMDATDAHEHLHEAELEFEKVRTYFEGSDFQDRVWELSDKEKYRLNLVQLIEFQISPNGRFVAFIYRKENQSGHIVRVKDRWLDDMLSDILTEGLFSNLKWAADGLSFFYCRREESKTYIDSFKTNAQPIFEHVLGARQDRDRIV